MKDNRVPFPDEVRHLIPPSLLSYSNYRKCVCNSGDYIGAESAERGQLLGGVVGGCRFIRGLSRHATGRCLRGEWVSIRRTILQINHFLWKRKCISLDLSFSLPLWDRFADGFWVQHCAIFGRPAMYSAAQHLFYIWSPSQQIGN